MESLSYGILWCRNPGALSHLSFSMGRTGTEEDNKTYTCYVKE